MHFRQAILCGCIAMLLSGCVIFQQSNRLPTPPGNPIIQTPFPLDLLFAKKPPNQFLNDPFQSLYITVINKKSQTIVNVTLDSSILDTLYLTAQIYDFQKNENILFRFTFSQHILAETRRQQISANSYKLIYPSDYSINSPGKEHLFYETEVRSFYDDLFYTYSGKLINDIGTEVSFWGQTDPVGPIPFSAVVSICSYISEKRKLLIDFCTNRYNKMRKVCSDQNKIPFIKLKYNKPMFKIGDFSIGNDLISDCDIICMPRSDKK